MRNEIYVLAFKHRRLDSNIIDQNKLSYINSSIMMIYHCINHHIMKRSKVFSSIEGVFLVNFQPSLMTFLRNIFCRIGLLLLCFGYSTVAASDIFSTGVMTLSATSSIETLRSKNSFNIGDFLSPKGEVILEEVMFSIEDDMNDSGAVKLHLVIAYESELVSELKKMSSQTYFSSVEQLVKDHPEKIKVFEWKLTAKKRVTSLIPIPHDTSFLTPLGGFIFANYSSPGDHRSAIPKTCKKMKIVMEKKDFKITPMGDED